MCAPTGKFEPPNFSESYEDVRLLEVFNVTLPMNEDEDIKFEDQKTVEGDNALPTYTDDQNIWVKGGHLEVRTTAFKRIDPQMTQKQHESFVDAIFRGRKRPLAKRKSKAKKEKEVAQAMEEKAEPFQKKVVVKETTQDWLDRAANEHLEGKKNARRNKLKTTMNSDG
ncbi:unnamed protein product [Calypogeia fissa]